MSEDFTHPGSDVGPALRPFREALTALQFPLDTAGSNDAAIARQDAINQLDDYLIPRYDSLEAPLLAVFGGSTGAGKSTLLNSILGEVVALASAIRPTTRRPLLVFHPQDAQWFTSQRILPQLARVRSHGPNAPEDTGEAGNELEIRPIERVPRGIALLDSPDIDSVVAENRQLAAQFLAAADLWVFVTTAARYADAIPWAMLDSAAERNAVVAIVLNRVPAGTGAQVRADLDRMLAERGLEHAPLFVLSEQELDAEGQVSPADVAAIRGWLEGLAADAAVRASVARQTLAGTIRALTVTSEDLLAAYDAQLAGVAALRWDVTSAFDAARANVSDHLSGGTMLRGEVLARWQDVVGTGQWARKLEQGVSSLRDRIAGFFRASVNTAEVDDALEDSLRTLIVSETEQAHARVSQAWSHGIGEPLDKAARERITADGERRERVANLIREWQTDLIAMIRTQGESKRLTARALAFSVNAIGTALIIVVFASTGGLVGGEIAVAGGTAVVAQRVLEAVFGDDAVRRMAAAARKNLDGRVAELLERERAVWLDVIDELGIGSEQRATFAAAQDTLVWAQEKDRRSL